MWSRAITKISFKISLLSLLSIVLMMVSCKSTQMVEKDEVTISPKKEDNTLYNKIYANIPRFETATSKCNISLGGLSSKAQIKIINGKYIQISLQPLLGIEVARAMITPDSLYLIDKINSQVAIEPLSECLKYLPQGAGIGDIQNLLLGIPFVFGETLSEDDYDKFDLVQQADGIAMNSKLKQSFATKFAFKNDATMVSSTVEHKNLPVIHCKYSDMKQSSIGGFCPSELDLTSSVFPGVSLKISGLSFDWSKPVSTDIKISSRYKRISLSEIIDKYLK